MKFYVDLTEKHMRGWLGSVWLFLILQTLDIVTTLIGLRHGGVELSPFIRLMLWVFSPYNALLTNKILACVLAAIAIKFCRRLLVLVNIVFAVLVASNFYQLSKVSEILLAAYG